MKSAIALFPMLLLLAACGNAPGKLTDESVALIAPDVPAVAPEIQKKAADEIDGGQCPALNVLAGVALVTRDQARALSK